MEKEFNNKVLAKTDEIVEYIKSSPTYQRYLQIEKQMNQDKNIKDLIKRVKLLQQKIVKLEYNKKDITEEEKELDSLLKELNSFPIYQEYTYLLEDLNNTLDNIKYIIEEYLNNLTN